MADKGKKGKGGGSKGASAAAAVKTPVEEHHDEAVVAEAAPLAKAKAHDDHAHDGHGHAGHGAAAHAGHGHAAGAHGHKPNIKEYLVIFVVLTVLTALEVAIANPSLGISKTLMRLGLVGMALSKAAIVGLYYMHLKHETRVLR